MTTDECVVLPRLTSRPRRDQASRAISTARLKRSRALDLPPINLVVSQGPSGVLRPGSVHLGEGFPLRCIQRLSPRDIANRRCAWRHSRDTRGRFVRVLSYYGRRPSTLHRPHRIQTELSHDVLNPAHVPLYPENSRTIGTSSSHRMGKADIEVQNRAVDVNSR